MARARWSAIKIALFGRPLNILPPRCGRDIAVSGCERLEDRLQLIEDLSLSADHEAIPAFRPPDSAARADVQIMDALFGQHPGSPHIIFEMRIAAVDDDVAAGEQLGKRFD